MRDRLDLVGLPAELQNKLRNLSPDARERVRSRVVKRMGMMTPKKARRLGLSGLGEETPEQVKALAESKAAEILKTTPPVLNPFDKQTLVGPWGKNTRVIPASPRFSPRPSGALVDIPTNLREGIRNEIVERYAVPENQADAIASNAIDRWIEMKDEAQPELTTPKLAKDITATYEAAFRVDRISGNLGDFATQTQAVAASARSMGWKSIVPLAIGAGIVVWLLRGR